MFPPFFASSIKLYKVSKAWNSCSTWQVKIFCVFRKAVQILGPVYILVNCAGFATPKTFENSTIDEETQQMQLNFFGSTKATRAVLPEMKNNNGGHIVFVASQGGLIGLYGLSSYCASKFAIRGFAESLAMG